MQILNQRIQQQRKKIGSLLIVTSKRWRWEDENLMFACSFCGKKKTTQIWLDLPDCLNIQKADTFFVLLIEISIHPTTLNIICPQKSRGSFLATLEDRDPVRPRSRGLEKAGAGVDHMSWDRALHCWHLPGLASGPPEVEPSTRPGPATVRGRRGAEPEHP